METTLLGLASRRYAKKVQLQGLVATLQTDWTEPFNSQSVERIRQDVGFCLFVILFIITIEQLCNFSFIALLEAVLKGGDGGCFCES